MNIAICDDHKIILSEVESLVRRVLGNGCNVSAFMNGCDLTEYIYCKAGGDIDILISDIMLGNTNGIELVKKIKKDFPNIKTIFITGYAEYSQEIFEAEPSYFLLKPLNKDKFRQALDFVIKTGENDNERLLPFRIKGGDIKNFKNSDIASFESRMRKVILHGKTGEETEMYGKLDEIERRLPENFIRCHQSYIVNMNFAVTLNTRSFTMRGCTEIPVSQAKYGATKRRFILFHNERYNRSK